MIMKKTKSSRPIITPKPGSVKVFRALHKYTAKYEDELSYEEGDILYVFDMSNPKRWNASCGIKNGLIPSECDSLVEIFDPLHEAARRGNLSFLKNCLHHKISSTSLDAMGNTPLYWASHSGHIDCLKYLLNQSKLPINAQNHFGDTPLHGASAKNNCEVVEILLRAGANPNIKNSYGKTPEQLAMTNNIKNLIQNHKMKSLLNNFGNFYPEDYEDESD